MSAYAYSVLAIAGINVILAVSLNVISGFCGQFSLGHAAFYGTGAYATALFAAGGSPLAPSLLAGIAVAALLGFVVGFASLRLRHDFLAVTTMGVSFLFVGFVRKQSWLGAEMGISRIPSSGLGSEGNALLILACALGVIVFSLYIHRSWMGFGFRAVGDDEDTARSIGISITAYKLVAFTLGTAIAGLAGGLYAYFTQFIVPDSFGFIVSVMVMAMVVIGGTGSTLGVVAAAIILTLLPEVFRFMNEYRLLVFGGLLVLVVRFAPGGIAGIGRSAIARVRGQ
jgi:branched-chain amino acid transport system permease protein